MSKTRILLPKYPHLNNLQHPIQHTHLILSGLCNDGGSGGMEHKPPTPSPTRQTPTKYPHLNDLQLPIQHTHRILGRWLAVALAHQAPVLVLVQGTGGQRDVMAEVVACLQRGQRGRWLHGWHGGPDEVGGPGF